MIEVDVLVPLYNAENYLDGLLKSIYKQKGIKINKVLFAITESNDNTLSLIKEFNNVSYFVLTGKEFSHSLTREQGIQSCTSKFVIMMTQDVIIEDSYAFYNLVNGLNESPDIVFSFGRQISKYKIEGELRREVALNIKRLMEIGCYRGLRHRKGLPVRGQNTRNNARTRKGPARTIANKKK